MPKISAPTVAEHRIAQRAGLVLAAEAVLVESGVGGVTPRAVCERAGLARSSFYDYFPSRDDLLVAVAIDALERWDVELEQALAGVEPGLPRLRTYIDATMRMTADGRHDIAGALREADLAPSRYEDLMALHDALMRPVIHVVAELDIPDPQRHAVLIQGLVGSGMKLVTHGGDPETITDDVYRVLTAGLPRDAARE